MADPISQAITAFATWVSSAAANVIYAATEISVQSAAFAEAVRTVVFYGTQLVIYSGPSAAIAPMLPRPL